MRVSRAVVLVSVICVLWILTVSAAYQRGNASVDPAALFDFSLTSSDGITVTPGGSGSNTIIVTLLSGMTQAVTLSADVGTTGIAFAVIISFNPRTVTPTCRSTCTITASSSAPIGSYPITVIGTGGGLTRATSFTLTVSTLGEKGSTWIVLDASPKPGYPNNPVTISGTVYGSWRSIWQGKVVGKPVEIATCWGFRTVVTTDYANPGQFSVTTNCPSQEGTYTITATFSKDEDLTGTSTTIQYEVTAKIPTTITISYVGNRQFEGYLRRADTGAYLTYKPVRLTVTYLYTGTWWTATYELQTRYDGYWSLEFLFFWNSATIIFQGDETYASSSNTITR
nr:hypothetical protein [Candidatus Njordarchaeum guaymaensis]